jgi:hypothetical protein
LRAVDDDNCLTGPRLLLTAVAELHAAGRTLANAFNVLLQLLLLESAWGSSWVAQCRNMITTGVETLNCCVPSSLLARHVHRSRNLLLKTQADEKGHDNGVKLSKATLLCCTDQG